MGTVSCEPCPMYGAVQSISAGGTVSMCDCPSGYTIQKSQFSDAGFVCLTDADVPDDYYSCPSYKHTFEYLCANGETAAQTQSVCTKSAVLKTDNRMVPKVQDVCPSITNKSGWQCMYEGSSTTVAARLFGNYHLNEQAKVTSYQSAKKYVCTPMPVVNKKYYCEVDSDIPKLYLLLKPAGGDAQTSDSLRISTDTSCPTADVTGKSVETIGG